MKHNVKPHKNPALSIRLHTPHSIHCSEQANLDLIIGCKLQMLVAFTMEHKAHISVFFFYRSKCNTQKTNQKSALQSQLDSSLNKWTLFSINRNMCTILKGHFGVAKHWRYRNSNENIWWKHTVEPMSLHSNSCLVSYVWQQQQQQMRN